MSVRRAVFLTEGLKGPFPFQQVALGFIPLVYGDVKNGDAIDVLGILQTFAAKGIFHNTQGLFVMRFGPLVFSSQVIQIRQRRHANGIVGVVGAKDAGFDVPACQHFFFRVGKAPLILVKLAQIFRHEGVIGVIFPEGFLRDGQSFQHKCLTFIEDALVPVVIAQRIEYAAVVDVFAAQSVFLHILGLKEVRFALGIVHPIIDKSAQSVEHFGIFCVGAARYADVDVFGF